MYIRTRDEALDALAETLHFPERRSQLIDLTVKIIVCLHPDPRHLLADCQALLVRGTLADMARRRLELLEQAKVEEIVLVLDPEEDRLYDILGRAQDGLRLGSVAAQVFPDLAAAHGPWEFGRVGRTSEAVTRECVTDAVRARGDSNRTDVTERAMRVMQTCLLQSRPCWADRLDALGRMCEELCGPGAEAASLAYTVAAADEDYVIPLLTQLERSPSDALASLTTAREIVSTLRRLSEEVEAAEDSTRRVA